ncbi:MAG: ribulose-phosphate 3-epimerase [Bacillota bacterium]|jgi:ribulose-phosphate 3-epimerase
MIKIAPSILGADLARLGQEIQVVEEAGAELLHLDIMDGNFVPNISFGLALVKKIRPHSRLIFDAHLMVNEPGRFIDDFVEAGADLITIHHESCLHIHRVIQQVKDCGIKVGVALNPGTPVAVLADLLPELNMVTLMSVNPGFCGQKFIPFTLEKCRSLSKIRDKKGLDFDIQIDGGVGLDNVEEIVRAGANVLVAAAAIFGAADSAQAVRDLLLKAESID